MELRWSALPLPIEVVIVLSTITITIERYCVSSYFALEYFAKDTVIADVLGFFFFYCRLWYYFYMRTFYTVYVPV